MNLQDLWREMKETALLRFPGHQKNIDIHCGIRCVTYGTLSDKNNIDICNVEVRLGYRNQPDKYDFDFYEQGDGVNCATAFSNFNKLCDKLDRWLQNQKNPLPATAAEAGELCVTASPF